MKGFEPRISGVGSNRSTNCATIFCLSCLIECSFVVSQIKQIAEIILVYFLDSLGRKCFANKRCSQFHSDRDTLIIPLTGLNEEAKYEPVISDKYLLSRLQATFQWLKIFHCSRICQTTYGNKKYVYTLLLLKH